MRYRLAAFDLDGTLTAEDNFWDRIHKKFGCMQEANRLRTEYERTKNYKKWFDDTLLLWKGREFSEIEEIITATELTPGARETCETLKKAGMSLAIISSGLAPLAKDIGEKLGIEKIFCNEFNMEDGKLTGDGICRVGLENKDSILRALAQEEGITLGQCMAVGDHRNDIPMVKAAGLGISFCSQAPELDANANVVIKRRDLREILSYI